MTKGKATAKKPHAKTTKKKKTETSSSEEDEDEEDAYISEEDEEEEEEEEEESEEDDEDDEGESDGDTDGGGVKSTKNPKEVAPEILKKLHMFDHVPPPLVIPQTTLIELRRCHKVPQKVYLYST